MKTRLVNGIRETLSTAEETAVLAEETAAQTEAAAQAAQQAALDAQDWSAFRAELLATSDWNRIYEDAPAALRNHLEHLMWRVGQDASLFTEIATTWGQILTALSSASAPISSGEITAINSICTTHQMLFRLHATTGAFELTSS